MKKTLIALAVAASAAVSGSAMAWTANGTGGTVELGGTLTPVAKITPWEVKTGTAVTGLDADIQKGQSTVDITVNKAIPVLGIRTQTNTMFPGGQTGIVPQISYANNAVDIDGLSRGVTTLTLNINDTQGSKIGVMTVPYSVAGVIAWSSPNGGGKNMGAYAPATGDAFFGGVAKDQSGALNYVDSEAMIRKLDATVLDNYVIQGANDSDPQVTGFRDPVNTYDGAYASGIEQGKTMRITLDTPAAGDAQIAWKASLPVTVTYQ